jgi:hypothetical protein
MKPPNLILAVLLLSYFTCEASATKWTDSTGTRTLEAELIGFKRDGATVTLAKVDGTTVDVPIDKLIDADRKRVRDVWALPLVITNVTQAALTIQGTWQETAWNLWMPGRNFEFQASSFRLSAVFHIRPTGRFRSTGRLLLLYAVNQSKTIDLLVGEMRPDITSADRNDASPRAAGIRQFNREGALTAAWLVDGTRHFVSAYRVEPVSTGSVSGLGAGQPAFERVEVVATGGESWREVRGVALPSPVNVKCQLWLQAEQNWIPVSMPFEKNVVLVATRGSPDRGPGRSDKTAQGAEMLKHAKRVQKQDPAFARQLLEHVMDGFRGTSAAKNALPLLRKYEQGFGE